VAQETTDGPLLRGLSATAWPPRFPEGAERVPAAFLRGRLARVPDEVEDLVQETLLAIHNRDTPTMRPSRYGLDARDRAYKMLDFLRRRAAARR